MGTRVDVRFHRLDPDVSVESSIQRWVARLEQLQPDGCATKVTIERASWRRIKVSLTITPVLGSARCAHATHADVYVAVADAFRAIRQSLLVPVPAAG